MKKLVSLLLVLALALGLCACGGSGEGVSYTVEIPKGFKNVDTSAGVEWQAKDYEETEYSFHAYDVGHSVYTNEALPTTFEEWNEKATEEGVANEKIFFEYNDSGKYEEYTMVYKTTYTEGSTVYNLAKVAEDLENIDLENVEENENAEAADFPEKIEKCYGKKVIVDKKDRSKAIVAVANSNDLSDAAEIQSVLETFNWK